MRIAVLIADLRTSIGLVGAIALMALCATMAIFPTVLPIFLIAGLIGSAWFVWRKKDVEPIGSRWSIALVLSALLYLLHVVGLVWSVNFDYALFDLQIKAPLLAFPLIYFLGVRISGKGSLLLFWTFIAGNVLAVLICSAAVFIRYFSGNGLPLAMELYGENFSFLMHPSYFALYLCFALAVVFLRPITTGAFARTLLPIGIILCVGVVLCGSKAGWATLPFVLLGSLWVQCKLVPVRRALFVLLFGSVLGGAGLVTLVSGVRERVVEAWHSVMAPETNASATTSSEVRKLAWNGALEVIHNNALIGTGTGDVKDELIKAYEQKGYMYLVERRINAHSQYLQLWAAFGWSGLALTLALVILPLLLALRSKHALAVLFFLLCAMNWAVESMLEVQAGAVFFAFFAFLLSMHNSSSSLNTTS